ncbi:hypothetical protein HDV04_001967 [Boothiomyces sp. JEL0838]|nr:hypothetical protein HDV04_001967 [Boothiomyces sp. JEL0838]
MIVLFRRSAIPTKVKLMLVISIWLFVLVLSSFPFIDGEEFILHSSGTYCMIVLDSKKLPTQILWFADVLVITLVPWILISIFYLCYSTLKVSKKSKATLKTSQQIQLLLVKKGILMTIAHIVSWSFTSILFIYQYSTNISAPYWMDVSATILSICSLSLNPIIFYIVNHRTAKKAKLQSKLQTQEKEPKTTPESADITQPMKTMAMSQIS